LFPQLREWETQPKSPEKAPMKKVSTPPPPAPVSETAAAVLQKLTAEPQPVDEIAAQAALSMPQVLAALTELEMFGCAAIAAGQQYYKL
jgi:predicted Rossmann fold nucleotide-binding protein DprA/Smf involved in DNA uptake